MFELVLDGDGVADELLARIMIGLEGTGGPVTGFATGRANVGPVKNIERKLDEPEITILCCLYLLIVYFTFIK